MIVLAVILLVCLGIGVFSLSGGHNKISDYELYGESGADEWERNQMGLTKKQYKKYRKTGVIKKKNDIL